MPARLLEPWKSIQVLGFREFAEAETAAGCPVDNSTIGLSPTRERRRAWDHA